MEPPAATPSSAPSPTHGDNGGAAGVPPAPEPVEAAEGHPHDFTIQKEVHRQIRNDPDYDDWEYGTEPLPQESWSTPAPSPADSL